MAFFQTRPKTLLWDVANGAPVSPLTPIAQTFFFFFWRDFIFKKTLFEKLQKTN